ncbi:MAG: 50S ribosomal protein L15 [Candidatus Omnitrophota bacterium]
MNLTQLFPAEGSTRRPKRGGRGRASGRGKTSGRGQKGQTSRSGRGPRLGLEGGQMPLIRRLPKRGFNNAFKRAFRIINVGQLNRFREGTAVSPETLEEAGLIQRRKLPLKILGGGDLKKALQVSAHQYSQKAQEVIEKLGGKALVIGKENAASIR